MTVKPPAVPAVIGDGKPVTLKWFAAPGVTTIPVCEAVSVGLAESAIVIDCVPTVFSVAVKVWLPESRAVY